MADIWFISDTHFFHDNIIRYCGRPFANSKLMNECLVENWNNVVKPQDKVYHLGDVAMCEKDNEIHNLLKRLNGKKRLILGNHDNPKASSIVNNFEKIMLWNGFYAEGIGFTVGHIPFPIEHLRDGKYMLHGHTHTNILSNPHYLNCCVENIGYTPIHIEIVADILKKRVRQELEDNPHSNP